MRIFCSPHSFLFINQKSLVRKICFLPIYLFIIINLYKSDSWIFILVSRLIIKYCLYLFDYSSCSSFDFRATSFWSLNQSLLQGALIPFNDDPGIRYTCFSWNITASWPQHTEIRNTHTHTHTHTYTQIYIHIPLFLFTCI
jgi:hypothetical protein